MPEYKITTVFKLKKYVVKEYQRLNALNFNLKGPISDQNDHRKITPYTDIPWYPDLFQFHRLQDYDHNLHFGLTELIAEPMISTEKKCYQISSQD